MFVVEGPNAGATFHLHREVENNKEEEEEVFYYLSGKWRAKDNLLSRYGGANQP